MKTIVILLAGLAVGFALGIAVGPLGSANPVPTSAPLKEPAGDSHLLAQARDEVLRLKSKQAELLARIEELEEEALRVAESEGGTSPEDPLDPVEQWKRGERGKFLEQTSLPGRAEVLAKQDWGASAFLNRALPLREQDFQAYVLAHIEHKLVVFDRSINELTKEQKAAISESFVGYIEKFREWARTRHLEAVEQARSKREVENAMDGFARMQSQLRMDAFRTLKETLHGTPDIDQILARLPDFYP